MPNEDPLGRIDTALDADSELSDSKPTASRAGTADTNWLLRPAPKSAAPESAQRAGDSTLPSTAYRGHDPPLQQFGRYRLEKVLGRGGMGEVWLAYDPQLHRRVAIKTVRPDVRFSDDALAMFLEEGRRLASFNHAGIIPVYDCGNEQGVCYLVSEYVAHGTLADYLKRQSPTHEQAAQLVAHIAEAAHYAHLRGLVHRDIKPANILMREADKPLLADFGLAIAEEEQLREAPGTLGTYAYMAPEQMQGESRFVDGRADIYSLGVVLYELLTGRLPYLAKSRDEYRALALARDPRPPRSVRDDIPAELEAICLKCLARQPAARYSTAGDLAAALRTVAEQKSFTKPRLSAVAADTPGGTSPSVHAVAEDRLPPVPPRSSSRWWWSLGIGLATAGATVALVAGLSLMSDGTPSNDSPSGSRPVVFEELDNEAIKPLVKYDLLNREPTVLSWHATPLASRKFDPELRQFRASTSDLGMFAFGSAPRGNYVLQMDLFQNRWPGGIGVFWGFQPVKEGSSAQWKAQVLLFQTRRFGSDVRELPMTVTRYVWRLKPNPDGTLDISQRGLTSVNLPQIESRPCSLELLIADHGLTNVRFAGRALNELSELQVNDQLVAEDYVGQFGLVTIESDGMASNASIMFHSQAAQTP